MLKFWNYTFFCDIYELNSSWLQTTHNNVEQGIKKFANIKGVAEKKKHKTTTIRKKTQFEYLAIKKELKKVYKAFATDFASKN